MGHEGIDENRIIAALKAQRIETPSWAYGDGGTRFKVFSQKGSAKSLLHKLEDAACVHRLTGVAPTVAVHALWDFADTTPAQAVSQAKAVGIRIGAVNPTLFEQDEYKLGSIGNPDPAVQQKALAHVADCVDAMRVCGSAHLSLWFADGTNYPGQDDLRARRHRVAENLKRIHDMLDDGMEMLIEYKMFEPAFYSTDIADWGMAYLFAKSSGPKAKVLVDLGHHALGTNIEQIVALLMDEDMLGGFHFNSKKYADDDLTTASMNPYELFLIFNELASAAGGYGLYGAAYMIDQSHNIKPKIEAMIQSVMSIQEIYAKVLVVDRDALERAQDARDTVTAESVLRGAFFTDVKPILAAAREQMGLDPDPIRAYRESGYQDRIEQERS
jgi:L-rhamnose isomerase/sugar isomerase